MIFYRQCVLEKKRKVQLILGPEELIECVIEKTSFIPEKYAIKGNYIKIKEDGEWSNGWQIMEVGTRLIEECLPDHHEDRKGFASLDKNEK